MLTAYFYHKTTGSPLVGGSPTINIWNSSNNTMEVTAGVMEAGVSPGWYYYNFTGTRGVKYGINYISGDANYISKEGQDYEAHYFSGNISNSQYDFNASDRKNISNLLEKYENIEKALKTYFNETNSRIEVAKGEITDKIDSIDIPEVKFEESEARKATKMIEKVDKKLSSYIESEMIEKQQEKAKEEAEKEEEMRKQEEEQKMEEERQRKEKEIEDMLNMEFDKLDEEEKMEKKKELEKELEETLKEAEEIKKELNSL